MKMFNLLDFGERAGSGVPNILQTWEAQNWASPQVEEQYGPDRTILTLTLKSIASEGHYVPHNVPRNVPHEIILKEIQKNKHITQSEFANQFGVTPRTIKRWMQQMQNVHYIGRGSNGHWEIIDEE